MAGESVPQDDLPSNLVPADDLPNEITSKQGMTGQLPQSSLDMLRQAATTAITKGPSTVMDALKPYLTDPKAMANALPAAGGAIGTLAGPGGMTAGTMIGTNARDIANTLLQSPNAPKTGMDVLKNAGIAGATSGILEGAGGMANHLMNLAKAGQGMGIVEKAAGITDRVPLFRPTASNLGQTLDALEDMVSSSLKGATKQFLGPKLFQGDNVIGAGSSELAGTATEGTITDPQTAKDALNLLKDIRDNPKLYGMSKVATAQVNRIWPQAQQLVSTLVDSANADAIKAGTLPARADLVNQAAKYFNILAPAKAVGNIANFFVGNPYKAGASTFAANQILTLLKKLGGH